MYGGRGGDAGEVRWADVGKIIIGETSVEGEYEVSHETLGGGIVKIS